MPIIAIMSLAIALSLFATGLHVMFDTYRVLTSWENNNDE